MKNVKMIGWSSVLYGHQCQVFVNSFNVKQLSIPSICIDKESSQDLNRILQQSETSVEHEADQARIVVEAGLRSTSDYANSSAGESNYTNTLCLETIGGGTNDSLEQNIEH